MKIQRWSKLNELPVIEEISVERTITVNNEDICWRDTWFIRRTPDGKFQVYGDEDYNEYASVEAARNGVSLIVDAIFKPVNLKCN